MSAFDNISVEKKGLLAWLTANRPKALKAFEQCNQRIDSFDPLRRNWACRAFQHSQGRRLTSGACRGAGQRPIRDCASYLRTAVGIRGELRQSAVIGARGHSAVS